MNLMLSACEEQHGTTCEWMLSNTKKTKNKFKKEKRIAATIAYLVEHIKASAGVTLTPVLFLE